MSTHVSNEVGKSVPGGGKGMTDGRGNMHPFCRTRSPPSSDALARK